MTSINADTITASDALAIETGARTAAIFGNDGAASLVLGDPASSAYELKAPYVPQHVTDNANLFDAKLAFSPADNTLGRADAFDTEPFWELDGGAFHIRGANHATGGAVSYIFRIGAHDELEVVERLAEGRLDGLVQVDEHHEPRLRGQPRQGQHAHRHRHAQHRRTYRRDRP